MKTQQPITPRFVVSTWLVVGLFTAAADAQSRGGRPETLDLTTKDGVRLAATYYPSPLAKEATPVVLVHDYKDGRKSFNAFARRLQSPGEGDQHESFAVVTVDLRGHGESTKQVLPNGNTVELDAAKLRSEDVVRMVQFDMEAVRQHLADENDRGNLNLNKLSLVGVGLGANVATLWAAKDWSMPPLAVGKQGQDVKALVLVSPRWKNRGLQMHLALRQPGLQRHVAMLLLYGRDDRSVTSDVRRIYKQLERYHPEPESTAEQDQRDLVALGSATSLQGKELLRTLGDQGEGRIIDFLRMHVAEKDFQWLKREPDL